MQDTVDQNLHAFFVEQPQAAGDTANMNVLNLFQLGVDQQKIAVVVAVELDRGYDQRYQRAEQHHSQNQAACDSAFAESAVVNAHAACSGTFRIIESAPIVYPRN